MDFRWDIIIEYAPFLLKGTIAYDRTINIIYFNWYIFRIINWFRENDEK